MKEKEVRLGFIRKIISSCVSASFHLLCIVIWFVVLFHFLLQIVNNNVSGLACDHDRSQFRLDQRLDIVLHLCGHIISLFRDPGTGNLFLQICHLMHIIEIRSANIGILRYSLMCGCFRLYRCIQRFCRCRRTSLIRRCRSCLLYTSHCHRNCGCKFSAQIRKRIGNSQF